MANNDYNNTLDWDAEFTAEEVQNDFTLLPEGIYKYTVLGMERGEYTPGPNASGKIQAGTKMLTLSLSIDGGEHGTATLSHRLFMIQWAVNAFFISAGLAKAGDTISLKKIKDIPGSSGWCRLGVREWKGDDGKPRYSNQVERFLDPEKVDKAAVGAKPKQENADKYSW